MSDLDDSFAKLLGRQPSDAERQSLYRVRDALGLKNNDALWLVLMALHHYQGQYEKFPQTIAQAAKDTLVNFKVVADATVKASSEAAKADLAQAVASAAQEVANNTSAKQMSQWAAGCIAVTVLCVCLFGWYMHSSGKASGYQAGYCAGYTEVKDEKGAAAWANTPEGRLAYRFAQSGELQRQRLEEGERRLLPLSGSEWRYPRMDVAITKKSNNFKNKRQLGLEKNDNGNGILGKRGGISDSFSPGVSHAESVYAFKRLLDVL